MEKRTLPAILRQFLPIIWWAALLYGFFMILYPFLIGCGCPYYGGHTCGIKQYLDQIGSVVCLALWPVGIYLYRSTENSLILLHALLSMVTVFSSLVILCLGILEHYTPMAGEIELLVSIICVIPLFPYIGLLEWMDAGRQFYLFTLIYALIMTTLAIRRYRRLRQEL